MPFGYYSRVLKLPYRKTGSMEETEQQVGTMS